MDILDPLDGSNEDDMIESKVIITKTGLDSDEEQVVEHLSPQTLLETTDNEVQYSVRGPEGVITYRLLQVDDGSIEGNVPQIVSAGSNYPGGNVPIITSNVNGQLYVINNSNDIYGSQGGTRAIAPRSTIGESNTGNVTNIKRRDERRRATHNEVERRRRDKINNWITKLSKIVPESGPSEIKGNGHYDGQSKGGILAKACDYILELRDSGEKLNSCLRENEQLSQNVEILKQKNLVLERQNRELKELLKQNGIELAGPS